MGLLTRVERWTRGSRKRSRYSWLQKKESEVPQTGCRLPGFKIWTINTATREWGKKRESKGTGPVIKKKQCEGEREGERKREKKRERERGREAAVRVRLTQLLFRDARTERIADGRSRNKKKRTKRPYGPSIENQRTVFWR